MIKQKAYELGFLECGIAKAEELTEEAKKLEKWLLSHHQGEMRYMENHFEKRINPTLLVENAKSVISLSYNYFTSQRQLDSNAPKISKYAYGKDYHTVVKEKLHILFHYIHTEIQPINGRYFVDSAPVLERAWAVRSGIGWIGKNTMLISRQNGSFFFLSELIIDAELAYDTHFENTYCGTCTACISACPTQAIHPEGYLEAEKCISFLTIELKKEINQSFKGEMDNWMFGCDVCNDVCPWNRFATPHKEPAFELSEAVKNMTKNEWEHIQHETFQIIAKNSPMKRAGYNKLINTIQFLKKDNSI